VDRSNLLHYDIGYVVRLSFIFELCSYLIQMFVDIGWNLFITLWQLLKTQYIVFAPPVAKFVVDKLATVWHCEVVSSTELAECLRCQTCKCYGSFWKLAQWVL